MKTKRTMAMALLAGMLLSAPAYAGFYYGDETKGATLTTNEADINMRIRLQPRLDYGDIVKSKDGTAYEKDADMYLRRARLELGGSLIAKTIKYTLSITADKWDQAGHTGALGIQYANVEWEADDAISIVFGKEKLPYSRVSLTSSSKQLFIERPASTEAAKKLFGKTDAYYQPKLAARGRLLDGVISYEAALADGWQNGEVIQGTTTKVFRGKPLYVARVELSPPGWVEKKKSDAHLGKDQHLALGLNYAAQKGIEYNIAAPDYEEGRTLTGFDISGHYKGLGFQYENNRWAVSSDDPAVSDVKPKGWYAQAGYFIEGINIEPAARYEVYDQDSSSSGKKEKTSSYGINWYLKGHSLKAGLNRVTTKYEDKASGWLANDNTKSAYQIQVQMYY